MNSASELKFEIGHVLFLDIVGYSKLLITEQSERLQKLKEIVWGTEQFRLAQAEGKLLRLPTGDGGALVFRNNPEAPVLCAMEVSKELKRHPELQVRMGIHSGPVNEITDLNAQANIAGAGINIAQRVMDCGDAGHIGSIRGTDHDRQNPKGKTCHGMKGLIEEGSEILAEEGDASVLDAGIIVAAQKVEHYEIASYGSVRTFAELLGQKKTAELLQTTLDEESEANEMLNGLAESIVNPEALMESELTGAGRT
jgi:hypothetical protein